METSANKRDQDPKIEPDLLSTEQVVELLGLSAPTVRKLVKLGHLPAHRPPGGRKLLFLRAEILATVTTWGLAELVPASSPPIAPQGLAAAEHGDPDGEEPPPTLVLTIDGDGEERWEPLDSLRPDR